jgi:hypothetical protein
MFDPAEIRTAEDKVSTAYPPLPLSEVEDRVPVAADVSMPRIVSAEFTGRFAIEHAPPIVVPENVGVTVTGVLIVVIAVPSVPKHRGPLTTAVAKVPWN